MAHRYDDLPVNICRDAFTNLNGVVPSIYDMHRENKSGEGKNCRTGEKQDVNYAPWKLRYGYISGKNFGH